MLCLMSRARNGELVLDLELEDVGRRSSIIKCHIDITSGKLPSASEEVLRRLLARSTERPNSKHSHIVSRHRQDMHMSSSASDEVYRSRRIEASHALSLMTS